MTKLIAQAAVFVALTVSQAYAGSVTMTLDPASGAISGSAGTTVGWGFDIVNSTGDNLVIDGSYFCESGQDPVSGPNFTCGPNLGASTYTDFIATNLGVIAPGETIETFDGISQGLGAYAIEPSATLGATDSGTLVIVYDEYSSDYSSEIASNLELTADASVTVTPEPGTAVVLAVTLLISAFVVRRRLA